MRSGFQIKLVTHLFLVLLILAIQKNVYWRYCSYFSLEYSPPFNYSALILSLKLNESNPAIK